MEMEGGFIGSFDLVIPLTREASEEAFKYSAYSSVTIEEWAVDEPEKYENDIEQTLCSYRMTRDTILKKINHRFQDYF